jgi:hypothetical protein
MRVTRRFQLNPECREECTCLLLDQNMFSIGAREFVTFYDARRKDSVASTPIAKMGYTHEFPTNGSIAARSLAVKGCLLSVGLSTGGGVMFLDKRKLSSCVMEAGERVGPARSKFAAAMAECASSQADTALPAALMSSLCCETICAGTTSCYVHQLLAAAPASQSCHHDADYRSHLPPCVCLNGMMPARRHAACRERAYPRRPPA